MATKEPPKSGKGSGSLNPNTNITSASQEELSKMADTAMAEARKVGPDTQRIAEDIAALVGGTTSNLNYKGKKSILRKIGDEDNKNPMALKDLARTTIVMETSGGVNGALSRLRVGDKVGSMGAEVIKVKHQSPNDYEGYSGNIVNLRYPNGMVTEIQVNTAKMIYSKDLATAVGTLGAKRVKEMFRQTGILAGQGHAYYEQFRDTRNRKSTRANARVDSRRYYANFSS